MNFKTSMEAKEFLVARIAAEANREQVPLSDLERKMLFFSESYATLPDMGEIAEKFEREYDDEQYEKKIAALIKRAWRRDRKESPEMASCWREAKVTLSKEDHYILVVLSQVRPPGDLWKLLLTAVLVCVLGVFVVFCVAMDPGSQPHTDPGEDPITAVRAGHHPGRFLIAELEGRQSVR
jgi:hypothetical protein